MPTPTTTNSTGYWTEGNIVNGTNVGGGHFVAGTPPAGYGATSYSRLPTPTTTPPANPTITPTTPVDTKTPVVDEASIRNNQIAQRESQFNDIDQLYRTRIADMTKTETDLGAKDMARVNAITAMTGGAGGVDANSRQSTVDKTTNDIIQQKTDMLNNEKMATINGIYDKIDQNVLAEKNIQLNNMRADQTKAIDKMNTDAQNNVNAFATQGITWEKAMKDPTFVAEVGRTGKSAFEVQKLYNDALPNNLKPKEIFSGFKGNDFVQIHQNTDGTVSTNTYNAKELGIPNTVSDLGTVNMNNKVYWYDKKNPTNADGTPKLIEIGNKSTTATTKSNTTETTQQKNDTASALNWMRAQPDYKPEFETQFTSDPVIKAKVIEAWKTTKSSKTKTTGDQTP